MAVYRYVNIRLPEAKRLADLYGIAFDLNACRRYCERYVQVQANMLTQTGNSFLLESQHLECFSVYILVKYGRCFKGGVRQQVADEIRAILSPEDLIFHKLVLDIRDKHIAHSVNNFEFHDVKVWLSPEERGRRVDNVNIGGSYLIGLESEKFVELKQLIDKIILWIDGEKKREEQKLTQLVSEKYDLDYLYSLDAEAPDGIDYSRVLQARKSP
jgi:hypothetical protein